MPVCPVCEHAQQAGDTCEVCGKALADARVVDAPVEAMPGLESARWEEPFPEDAVPMAELEQTAQASVAVTAEPLIEMERTAMTPVEVAATAPVLDLDRGREADDGIRVPLPTGAATCRYCKNVQEVGLLCDRCGVRLPRPAPRAVAPRAPAPGETRRCIRCSEKVVPGTRCGGCGTLAAELEA